METEIAKLKSEMEELRTKNKTLKTALKLKDGKPELVSSSSMADFGEWVKKKDSLKKKTQDAEKAKEKAESENKELKLQREEMDEQLKKAKAEIAKLKVIFP